jgi:hypothetical protein
MSTFTPEPENPLKKYFRQAKIHVELPSKGNFYANGALEIPETGEIPVYAMTAKDELGIKTPDALLNGQAMVDMFQSCVPSIKNGWEIPSIDVDALLIAIRIATYGEQLELTAKTPNTQIEKDYAVDLREILHQLVTAEFITQINLGSMQVHVRPLKYKEFTKQALKTYEEQRIFKVINDETMSEEEKLSRFAQSFKNLTEMTVHNVSTSIHKIIVDDTEVKNPQHIKEFIDNADKDFYNIVLNHIEEQRKKFTVKPMQIKSTEEEIKLGAPETWELPVMLDYSNFFAQGS